MEEYNNFRKSGTFKLSANSEVQGELALKGAQTSLELYSHDFFDTHSVRDIHGIFHDRSKVSLLECITNSGPSRGSKGGEDYHFSNVFPHLAIFGDEHIQSTDRKICEMSFSVDDASTLFYDFDAFGSVVKARPHMERIIESKKSQRKIEIGDHPQIFYFTGKYEIFSAKTILGQISARHGISFASPSPKGIKLDNTIFLNIKFEFEKTIKEALDCIYDVLRFLEIIAGRPQNILKLRFRAKSLSEHPVFFDAYWSMRPYRNNDDASRSPHPSDLLLQAVSNPERFGIVFSRWLELNEDRRNARVRFSTAFAHQNRYTIDRLVGAANMFDILPASAVPVSFSLTDDIKQAKENARKTFKALPDSPERESILNALGRLGKATLKRKIRSRAKLITDTIGEYFPDLEFVIDQAVDCRNYYVHGSVTKINYGKYVDQMMFFTETLEFIFGASDLVDAGWDIHTWVKQESTLSHPFDNYRFSYSNNLLEFKELCKRLSISMPVLSPSIGSKV